MSTLIAKT